MAEVTSTPDDHNYAKHLAYTLDWRLPPPRKGRWFLPPMKLGIGLCWIGNAADLPDAMTPEVRQLMTSQETFYAIVNHHRIRLKYEPRLLVGNPRGPEATYVVCHLAEYGHYYIDDDGALLWFEVPTKPRLEPELSQLLKATKATKATKRSTRNNNG